MSTLNLITKTLKFASDQNECEEWGFCDQLCKNSIGGHECTCASGYIRKNGTTCMANPSMKKMMLYFNNYNKVMMIDSTGKQVKEVGNASAASGLDYHLGNKKLFYTDTEKRKVFVMSLTSNNGGQLLDYR